MVSAGWCHSPYIKTIHGMAQRTLQDEDHLINTRQVTSHRVGAPFTRLEPPDFFLWGYLKDRVYQDKPKTLTELKEKITDECKAIKPDVFKSVMNNFCLRLKKCKDLNGAHLEHLL